jgi:penicillin-binding protein 1C
VLALTAPLLLLAGVVAADRAFPPDLTRLNKISLEVQAADGTTLDVLQTPDGYWRLPASATDVSPNFLRLLVQAEDKRFWSNPGVDPLAMLRAAGQFLRYGHVVSGGSTLTMQVARLLAPHPHDLAGKFYDMARALQLTAHYSKPQILAMYLTLAPYGGNIEGVRAAALVYFQKPPAELTDAQAALLVAMPRSPARLRPDRHQAAAMQAARRVLAENGLNPDFPLSDLAPPVRHAMPALAPQLAWRLYGAGVRGIVRTTLNAALQASATDLLTGALPMLPGKDSIAALIVDNRSRAVLAYVGGTDGDVDMVRAIRSPGSTLKPFLYGMALDDSLIVPATMMQDTPSSAGGYAPHDFDGSYHGMVTAAVALQQSLNLPAVQLLRAEGPARFVATLRATGARLVLPGNAPPGLPVILGGVGISMSDLAMLYTGLADGGGAAPLRLLATAPAVAPVREMSPNAAAQIGAMLRGAPLPDGVARDDDTYEVAYKTGTSYGFRDAWAAGFSADYTIVVWTGRVDGTPVPGAYGRATAAPLLFRLFGLLPPDVDSPPSPAPGPALATLAPNLQVFGATTAVAQGPGNPRILFPPAGAVLQVTDGSSIDPVALEAAGGVPPYRWVINGAILPNPPVGMSMLWEPDGPGFAHISILDARDNAFSEDVVLH